MTRRFFSLNEASKDFQPPKPIRQTTNSAGYDFIADIPVSLMPGELVAVPTGVTVMMDSNEWLAVHIRSGLAFKTGLILANGVGVVDADYYPNEIKVLLRNVSDKPVFIKAGERIAQGIFQPYLLVDDDKPADRERTGGFGSTNEEQLSFKFSESDG